MNTPIDEIHVALSNMAKQVSSQAPHLRPTVTPSYLPLSSLSDICATKKQRENGEKWLKEKSSSDTKVGVVTAIDYPRRRVNIEQIKLVDSTEASLYSVDSVMQSMVSGTDRDFQVYVDKFLTANGYDTEETAIHRYIFTEVYNTSYAMKVLISNVGGFTAYIGGRALPLSPEDDIVEILESVLAVENDDDDKSNDARHSGKKKKKKSARHRDDSSDDDDDDDEEERVVKKRKHKRSKKK